MALSDSTLLYGHLAQLEEHPLDVRKVEGSSPPVSTIETAFSAVFLFASLLLQGDI